MKLRRAVRRLLGRPRPELPARAKVDAGEADAEKHREIEQLVQAGIAANKFPPR